jgi:hypothetical protein
MKLICPVCKKEQTIAPNALLGKFFVCAHCHSIVSWNDTIYRNQEEKNDNGGNPANKGANHTDIIS